jgi:pimeloyl-ACP methyl ester carboxylesterase
VKTLVLFHGWGTAGSIWRRQVEALGPAARVLAPDVGAWEPGWFRQYLAGLPMTDSLLVGWSLGGMLLLETLAQPHGARPAGLVLAGAAASFCRRPDFPWGQPAAGVRAMRRALRDNPLKVLQEFARNCLAPGEEAFREEAEAAFQAPAHPENLVAGLDFLLGRDLRGRLRHLPAAPVILQGEEDRIVAASQARFLHQQLPGSRLHLLTGAGHLPFLTQAAAFNGILAEILAGEG